MMVRAMTQLPIFFFFLAKHGHKKTKTYHLLSPTFHKIQNGSNSSKLEGYNL